jgi:hypothetical protein
MGVRTPQIAPVAGRFRAQSSVRGPAVGGASVVATELDVDSPFSAPGCCLGVVLEDGAVRVSLSIPPERYGVRPVRLFDDPGQRPCPYLEGDSLLGVVAVSVIDSGDAAFNVIQDLRNDEA